MQINVLEYIHTGIINVHPHKGFNMPFNSLLVETISIPSRFYDGLKWEIYFKCPVCMNEIHQIVSFKSGTFILADILMKENFVNDQVRIAVANVFKLSNISRGSVEPLCTSGTPSYFLYFKCKSCNHQYLLAYSMDSGEPNKNEKPDYVYLSGIALVEFDEMILINSLVDK